MKKFRLLLLDANVVIELFRQGIWDRLIDACDVHLAQTVVSAEAHFYEDDEGVRCDFDVGQYCQAGKISVFDLAPSELVAFRAQFDPTYFEKLDPGETESLAYLVLPLSSPSPKSIWSRGPVPITSLARVRTMPRA
jgi:hypothetical protein